MVEPQGQGPQSSRHCPQNSQHYGWPICRSSQSHSVCRWLHDRLHQALSALCSRFILSVSLIHRLLIPVFISQESSFTEDSRSPGLWGLRGSTSISMGFQETEHEKQLSSRYLAELCALDHSGHNLHFLFEQTKTKGRGENGNNWGKNESAKTIQWVIPEPDLHNYTGGEGKFETV
jgi:hypothetical protein